MTINRKNQLGALGETIATKYLEDKGYKIVDINWHARSGEIDIIALDGPCLVFVEVKTRASRRYGLPEESLTYAKARKIRLAARRYMAASPDQVEQCRIDMIAIELDQKSKRARLRHWQNAVDLPE